MVFLINLLKKWKNRLHLQRYSLKFTVTVRKACIVRYRFFKNLCLVIFFIHIIQLSLFSNEYLPLADKKVNIHY